MEVNGSLEIFQSQSEMALESGTEASGTAAEMHS